MSELKASALAAYQLVESHGMDKEYFMLIVHPSVPEVAISFGICSRERVQPLVASRTVTMHRHGLTVDYTAVVDGFRVRWSEWIATETSDPVEVIIPKE